MKILNHMSIQKVKSIMIALLAQGMMTAIIMEANFPSMLVLLQEMKDLWSLLLLRLESMNFIVVFQAIRKLV
jgi:hypothetical protein